MRILAIVIVFVLGSALAGAVGGIDPALEASSDTVRSQVHAAVNPLGRRTATTELTIARDGTYDAAVSITQEVRSKTTVGFGNTVRDGFRLPDDGSVIPPYLRVSYEAVSAKINGESEPFEAATENHAITLSVRKKLGEGEHRAHLKYRVTGAAVPIDGGYAVYLYPLVGGPMTITASDSLVDISCVGIPPIAVPCGTPSGDGVNWTVVPDELGAAAEVRVEIAADAVSLVKPNIDNG